MWIAIGVILNALILLGTFLIQSTHKDALKNRQEKAVTQSVIESPTDVYNAHKIWLLTRWEAAHNQLDSGELKTFPKCFFSEASEKQLGFLARKGLDQVAAP